MDASTHADKDTFLPLIQENLCCCTGYDMQLFIFFLMTVWKKTLEKKKCIYI